MATVSQGKTKYLHKADIRTENCFIINILYVCILKSCKYYRDDLLHENYPHLKINKMFSLQNDSKARIFGNNYILVKQ